MRTKLVTRTVADVDEGAGARRRTQERTTSGSHGALLLEGSFKEDLFNLGSKNSGEDADEAAIDDDSNYPAAAAQIPGDMGATWKGACQRLVPPQVPDLVVKKMWRSAKPRVSTDVTLVTQLSVDRLSALANQCLVWGGVISAAVHVAIVDGAVIAEDTRLAGASFSAPIQILEDFFNMQEESGRCKLDMMYIYEEVASLEEVGLYPVNGLRNRALQLANTDMVMLVDADFIPNVQLSEDFSDPAQYDVLHRATNRHQAIVLPALEILVEGEEGQRLAIKAAESKDNARRMMHNDRLQGFHMDGFVNGHRATQFDKWQEATVAYRATYEEVRYCYFGYC